MCEHIFENLNSLKELFPYFDIECSTCFLSKIVEQIKPIKVYKNFKEDRDQLMRDQKEKTGVYCLVNLTNGHIYIGSSFNLAVRMRNYLNTTFLKNKRNKNMPIIQALLKYGQDYFAVLIVEFVEVDFLAIRETHYITQLLPYYNVLKQGYSSLGYKHTEETKEMLTELAKNRIHSSTTKVLISRALVGHNNPFYNKNHSLESKLRIIEANSKYSVYIYNSFRELLVIFPSVKTLAKWINSNHSTLKNNIKDGTLFRGEWYFSYLPFNLTDTPLISNWYSTSTQHESNNLVLEMIKYSHIKKAIFVYNIKKEFIKKFEGVTHAQKELNINHDVIKKHALLNIPYNGYIFSYERLKDELTI